MLRIFNTPIIVVMLLIQFPFICFSQYQYVPLSNQLSWRFEGSVDSFTVTHLMMKPLYSNKKLVDSLYAKISAGFMSSDLFTLGRNRNLQCQINPLISSLYSLKLSDNQDETTKNLWENSIGFQLNSSFKNYITFNTNAYYNYTNYPAVSANKIDSTGFVPYHGEYMQQGKNNYYSWVSLRWRLLLAPADYLHVELGNDKQFLGEGYRSLFLSTNSNAYPYIKATVQAWRIKYLWMLCFLDDKYPVNGALTKEKKYCALHMLSYNVTRYLNINLFEAVIWRDEDTSGYRGIDVDYLNPIIFYRPIEHSLSSPDNEILGLGGKLILFSNYHIYSQFVMDEFILDEILSGEGSWTNKYGIQVGLKSYHMLGVKNLFFLAEYNTVRPYTYSHKYTLINYGAFSQPLAHPMGANFREYLGVINYQKNRWSFNLKVNLTTCGLDSMGSNWGQDIYKNYSTREQDYGNVTLQGVKTSVWHNELNVDYIINPAWYMAVEAGVRNRYVHSDITNQNNWYFFIGLRTLLYNDNEEDWNIK
jgi:hypothetical protein